MKGLLPQPLWLQGLFLVLGHIPPLQRADGQIVRRQDLLAPPPPPTMALTSVIFNLTGELNTLGEGHLLLQDKYLSPAPQSQAPSLVPYPLLSTLAVLT